MAPPLDSNCSLRYQPGSFQQGKFGCARPDQNVLMWLLYVEDNVKSASAENFASLKDCLNRATFDQSALSPEVKDVIQDVSHVVQKHMFNPRLQQKVQAAISSLSPGYPAVD